MIGTGVGYVIQHPLEDWAALETYTLPDPRLPSQYIGAGVGRDGDGVIDEVVAQAKAHEKKG